MKDISAIITSLGIAFFILCNNQSNFEMYVASLEEITLPIEFSSNRRYQTKSPNYDPELFLKYSARCAIEPYGKVIVSDSIMVIMDCTPDNGGTAIIYSSYRTSGSKLDSLYLYKKLENGFGSTGIATIKIQKPFLLSVIDSVEQWDINEDRTDVIENSKKDTTNKTAYLLNNDGKFKQLK